MNKTTVEPPSADSQASAASRRRRPPWLLVVVLVILVILVGAGYGGWHGWQWYQGQVQARDAQQRALQNDLRATHSQLATLQGQLAKADAAAADARNATQALQGRVDTMQQQLQAVDRTINGGRRGVQVAIVEQLLLSANEAVQLGRDPVAAERALAAADERLAALHDPQFLAVRQALADERSALAAVKEPDVTGTAIALGQLLDAVPGLPLRSAPRQLSAPTATITPGASQSAWARGWMRVAESLGALFRVQHHDHAIEPLLPVAEQRLVGAVLALRLDGARAALLQRNTPVYRDELKSAAKWVARYYRADAPATQALQERLLKLSGVDLSPSLPDISASLSLLRKQQSAAAE